MDKNSIIGLALIGLIIIGYSIYTQPGPEQIQAMKNRRDSIEKQSTDTERQIKFIKY